MLLHTQDRRLTDDSIVLQMIKLSVNSRTGYIASLQDLRFYSLQLRGMKSSKVGKLKGETICQ